MKYLLISILLVLAFSLNAQDTLTITGNNFTEKDINQFRYLNGSIACVTTSIPDPEEGYLDCLHIGDVRMKMKAKGIEKIFGEPYQVIDNENTQSRIYLLPTDGDKYPYLVVTYKKNKVDAIQLTGVSTTIDIDFSSIRLGDNEAVVKEILGPPSDISEVEQINGIKWSYNPFPISIEFIDTKVYSIRIYDNN